MSNDLARLIEALALAWLRDSDVGDKMLAEMSENEAVDAVFSLLNLGVLKLAVDEQQRPIGFTFSLSPQPIRKPIQRQS